MPSAMPPTTSDSLDLTNLPDCKSSTLELVLATTEEWEACSHINGASWSGPLSFEAYLRREKHLSSQPLTKDGGITVWILVDSSDKHNPRRILSACETIKKPALVAYRGDSVEDTIAHSIGSVFCRPEYRGKGYAGKMMHELGKKLEKWQQSEGKKGTFNVLYSDIGKVFYARDGWMPFPASHISLPPASSRTAQKRMGVEQLYDGDLEGLCKLDEQQLRREVGTFPANGPNMRVAFVPSAETLRWHHSREEFVAKEILGRIPEVKGAVVYTSSGKKVWCVWTRAFSQKVDESVFYILRLVVEDEGHVNPNSIGRASAHSVQDDKVEAVEACLRAAQQEAYNWNMSTIDIWNPSDTVVAAAKRILPSVNIINRENESIPCLKLYGSLAEEGSVEWIANEKFGWS